MSKPQPVDQVPERDRLMTRPDDKPLPTPLPPDSPEARGGPVDPRPVAKAVPGDTSKKGPDPNDIGRAV